MRVPRSSRRCRRFRTLIAAAGALLLGADGALRSRCLCMRMCTCACMCMRRPRSQSVDPTFGRWRGHQASEAFANLQEAALVLQDRVREWLAPRRTEREVVAATRIQAATRRNAVIRWFEDLRASTRHIQERWRGYASFRWGGHAQGAAPPAVRTAASGDLSPEPADRSAATPCAGSRLDLAVLVHSSESGDSHDASTSPTSLASPTRRARWCTELIAPPTPSRSVAADNAGTPPPALRGAPTTPAPLSLRQVAAAANEPHETTAAARIATAADVVLHFADARSGLSRGRKIRRAGVVPAPFASTPKAATCHSVGRRCANGDPTSASEHRGRDGSPSGGFGMARSALAAALEATSGLATPAPALDRLTPPMSATPAPVDSAASEGGASASPSGFSTLERARAANNIRRAASLSAQTPP